MGEVKASAHLQTHTLGELGPQQPGTPENSPVAPRVRNRPLLDSSKEVSILPEERDNTKFTLVTSPSNSLPNIFQKVPGDSPQSNENGWGT